MVPYKTRREMGYTALRRLRCRRMVLYGDWQQLYATVRCYMASGRTIISSASHNRGRSFAMHYGIYLPIFGDYSDPRLLAELAHEAEAAGWEGIFLWDHIHQWRGQEPATDPWV